MLHPYLDYFIEKPWKYQLYPEVFHSNIFCYGKPRSGRTSKVVIPVIQTAIKEGRSCIIYAEKTAPKYQLIKELALQRKYQLFDLEVTKLGAEKQEVYIQEITSNIQNSSPTLVLISNSDFKTLYQENLVDQLLENLYNSKPYDPTRLSKSRAKSTLVALDNLCCNMVLDTEMLKPTHLQFCITMDSQIAYLPWLKERVSEILEERHGMTQEIQQFVKQVATPVLVQRFFRYIETVICTGVNGIKPDMHREFVGGYMFDAPTIRIGGRFIIMETPPEGEKTGTKSLLPNPGKKIAINEETIEKSTYSEIAEDYIRAGHWVLEQDGKPYLYYDGSAYIPAAFTEKKAALEWLAVKLYNDKITPIHFEQAEGMVRCEGFKENAKTEFFFSFINKPDEESFRVAYYLRVLEKAEQEDLTRWLQTDEAIAQGYDPNDGIQKNIQKYYARLTTIEQPETSSSEAPTLPPIPAIDPYWKAFQTKEITSMQETVDTEAITALPENGVLFLGGHWNMVKKIQQRHPDWLYITDDQRTSAAIINVDCVFYWTAHSSHKMMENIFAKLAPDADVLYVTATNMERLENEMLSKFRENQLRKSWESQSKNEHVQNV